MTENKKIRLSKSGERRKSRDYEPAGNGIYFATKIEFIENWLNKYATNVNNNNSSYLQNNVTSTSPQKSIVLRSPLKDTNHIDCDLKRKYVFSNTNEIDIEDKFPRKVSIFKGNHDFPEIKKPTNISHINKTSKLNFKKYIESSFKVDDDGNNKLSLSPSSNSSSQLRVESIKSQSIEKDDIESILSSTPHVESDSEVNGVKIDEFMCDENYSNEAERNIQDCDENDYSKSSCSSSTLNIEKVDDDDDDSAQVKTQDSNETYCSEASKIQNIQKINEIEPSQIISDISHVSQDQPHSPTAKHSELMNYITMVHAAKKKKKKPKKGTIAARLQTLITGKVSCVHLWKHKMAQKHLKSANPEYFIFQIDQSISKYGRYFLNGKIINDEFNLLNQDDNLKIITIILIPAMVGNFNIVKNNLLKIYPPWEMISSQENVLSVLYFSKYENHNDNLLVSRNSLKKIFNIVDNYCCPCFSLNCIDTTCQVKFQDFKSNPMDYIFNN